MNKKDEQLKQIMEDLALEDLAVFLNKNPEYELCCGDSGFEIVVRKSGAFIESPDFKVEISSSKQA